VVEEAEEAEEEGKSQENQLVLVLVLVLVLLPAAVVGGGMRVPVLRCEVWLMMVRDCEFERRFLQR